MYKTKAELSPEEKDYSEKLLTLIRSNQKMATVDEYSLRNGSMMILRQWSSQ